MFLGWITDVNRRLDARDYTWCGRQRCARRCNYSSSRWELQRASGQRERDRQTDRQTTETTPLPAVSGPLTPALKNLLHARNSPLYLLWSVWRITTPSALPVEKRGLRYRLRAVIYSGASKMWSDRNLRLIRDLFFWSKTIWIPRTYATWPVLVRSRLYGLTSWLVWSRRVQGNC